MPSNRSSTSSIAVEALDTADITDTLRLTPSETRRSYRPLDRDPPPSTAASSSSVSGGKRPRRSSHADPSAAHAERSSPSRSNRIPGSSSASGRRPSRDHPRPVTPRRHHHPSPPREWPRDQISLPTVVDDGPPPDCSPDDALNHFYGSHDPFLSDLLNNDFSSPSAYPSFTTAPTNLPSPDPENRASSRRQQPYSATAADEPASNSQLHTQLSSSTLSSDNAFHSFSTDSGSTTQTGYSSNRPVDMAPSTRRRSASNAAAAQQVGSSPASRGNEAPAPKRRRTSGPRGNTSRPNVHKTPRNIQVDDNPFDDTPIKGLDDDDLYLIDLTDNKKEDDPADESSKQSEEPPQDTSSTMTKLSSFQCAICMDDATSLTATHCGHLYCAECLHSAIHVETTKGRCPMCRSKLDVKPREQYTTKTKGFYPLELKLMTVTRKGKRKVDTIS